MKFLKFFLLIFSITVNAQIELKFNDFYINNYSKISYKKIQVAESEYTNFDNFNRTKKEEKYWLKIEPRKLTKEEEIYNKDPNNLDVQFDYSTYIVRINIDCNNKFYKLIEEYRYDYKTQRLIDYNDFIIKDNLEAGKFDLNNSEVVKILEDSGDDDYYYFYLKKCKQK